MGREPAAGAEIMTAPPTPESTHATDADSSLLWSLGWPAGLFLIIAFFVGADLAADLAAGVSATHIVVELVALALALIGILGTALRLRAAILRARELHRDLQGTRADLERWREEARDLQRGLGTAIDQQFKRWGLTSAESEVALLILKGLSYKEVADARATTERTVRHQALAIYRKANLSGRAEMAAFFLEDLLLPRDEKNVIKLDPRRGPVPSA
jgi:DNA-binding CsgD family transcriptional regulator